MRERRFTITNRSVLQAEREVFPLAQHIARVLTSSGVVERFKRLEIANAHSDWMIFKDAAGGGFGARLDDNERSSPLQQTLRFVRHVQAIVKALGSQRSFPCVLTLEREPPPSWGIWELKGVAGTVWCAASIPLLPMPRSYVQAHRDPKVRVKLCGGVRDAVELEVGADVVCETIEVRMPEIGVRGRCVCKGEGMAIEIDECHEVREQQIPGVRLDLGEIEMRLSDLVGLRPGATINLGEVAFERCFVRLGATVLAEGKFRTSEGQLLLTIESVL